MGDRSFLTWPFFAPHHRDRYDAFSAWARAQAHDEDDVENVCRGLVRSLGEAGLLTHCAGPETPDVRTLCLAREALAYHSGLADFSFAMQGLGTGAISLFGSEKLKAAYLPDVARGRSIAGFALSETEAGSDVAAMTTTATPCAGGYRLSGEKTWISNGGIADIFTVVARTGEAPGARGLSAFVLRADSSGFEIAERINVMAPHPLARIRFNDVFIPSDHLIGATGDGFRVAMGTLDLFRSTVGAAALGFARRAFDEAMTRATTRKMFGGLLSDLQLTQAALADMALGIDASALLVYRAAWTKDQGQPRVTREAAMAKLHATDTAQEIIDKAVQIFGAAGVVSGAMVERLYRDIRALRIYEGASEVQKIVIARQAIADKRI